MVYDLANTIFALGVVGLYLPDWMSENGIADSYLAVTVAIAGAVVILAAPWVGARSDHSGQRMPVLVASTLVAISATALLARGPVWLTFAFLGVALIAVNVGSVVYDALLPDVSTTYNRGSVSGIGVGIGYVGSFVGLGIGVVTLDILELGHETTFLWLAAGFLGFALPTFIFVEERTKSPLPGAPPRLARVVHNLIASWRRAFGFPSAFRFLMGRFLYTDAINTLIGGFLALFALEELGLDRAGSRNLIGIAIVAAIAGGLGGGRLVERYRAKKVLRIALILWMVGIAWGVVAALTDDTSTAWMIGVVGGLALGATWASDRVLMIEVSPPEHLGEFYGLYATVGRFATILGPLVWALMVDVLDLGRVAAMVALGVFVLAGWVVIGTVSDD